MVSHFCSSPDASSVAHYIRWHRDWEQRSLPQRSRSSTAIWAKLVLFSMGVLVSGTSYSLCYIISCILQHRLLGEQRQLENEKKIVHFFSVLLIGHGAGLNPSHKKDSLQFLNSMFSVSPPPQHGVYIGPRETPFQNRMNKGAENRMMFGILTFRMNSWKWSTFKTHQSYHFSFWVPGRWYTQYSIDCCQLLHGVTSVCLISFADWTF